MASLSERAQLIWSAAAYVLIYLGISKTMAFPQSARSLFHVRVNIFGFPMLLLTVEGPKVPLSRGLFGCVALRCYAEECAFSLSTQAQDHVWDLFEYKRVEPAHCPQPE